MVGRIFDVSEFCLHDGPGLRTTVFFKGCPLRCQWCHNPESQRFEKERMVSPSGCIACGACKRVCKAEQGCVVCGACAGVCPRRLIKIVGTDVEAGVLAKQLACDRDVFEQSGGGVTLSGGEVLSQPEFLLDLLEGLFFVHRALDTSGYGPKSVFQAAARLSSLVLFDVKILDRERHIRYTGVDNDLIFENLRWLCASGIPFHVRVPLIPGVNDDTNFFNGLAARLAGAKSLLQVDLLPYNKAAGAKYPMVGRTYKADFDQDRAPSYDLEPFAKRGIRGILHE